ncbi:hypothetical protein JI664_12645 [Rhodobacter sp. NTK016B]|uniref:hypothetical protein n=1 Tax=Rhodobacter sp. NTK016B TaxID=2759676 RepID=UPI001A8DDBFE|nr:hypothetical protein [Rhodobacter sp. NTK016B]MBN8292815.1 hypothetical protein [Rhodobacter sp. NTK016B]
MSEDSNQESSTVRKVYVFPKDLADRISAFQKAKKLPSEVEAVRRLLDEALLHRDNDDLLLERLVARLNSDGMVTSAAKDVLVGHPLVASISFPSIDAVEFRMKNGAEYKVYDDGRVFEVDAGVWRKYEVIPF